MDTRGLARTIIGKGVDVDAPDSTGYTPLGAAALAGSIDVVRLLLDRGATVGKTDGRGRTALSYVEERDDRQFAAIKTLLSETGPQQGAYQAKQALTAAVVKRDVAAVKKLLAKNPDPRALQMSEDDPIAKALNTAPALIDVAGVLESREIVQNLVQNGATVAPGARGCAGPPRWDARISSKPS